VKNATSFFTESIRVANVAVAVAATSVGVRGPKVTTVLVAAAAFARVAPIIFAINLAVTMPSFQLFDLPI
jgi:hypothetical protein